jgi:hypothetical protein
VVLIEQPPADECDTVALVQLQEQWASRRRKVRVENLRLAALRPSRLPAAQRRAVDHAAQMVQCVVTAPRRLRALVAAHDFGALKVSPMVDRRRE